MQINEYEGIKKLYKGTRLLIFTTLLLGVFSVISIYLLLVTASQFETYNRSISESISQELTVISITFIISEFIGAITGITGLSNVRTGFKIFMDLGKDVGRGYSGAKLYLIALGLIIPGFILLPLGIGILILFIAIIFILIGDILIGIGFYKIGRDYNEASVKLGGIFIVIPFGVFSFIGFILVYAGLGKIKKTIEINQPVLTSAQQIYQIGKGTIKKDGQASISLYTPEQARITSARIKEIMLTSVSIIPDTLHQGQNEVIVKFADTSLLTPSSTYTVTFSINMGRNKTKVDTLVVYQP